MEKGVRILRRVKLEPFPPSVLAEFEISRLRRDRSLMSDLVLGGPTPPEMVAANAEKRRRFEERRAEIIHRHGVVEEYLAPLLKNGARLTKELEENERLISLLQLPAK